MTQERVGLEEMNQETVIKRTIDILEKIGIDYMLTGAIAVNFYGKPRLTHDIDIVVPIQKGEIEKLVRGAGDEFWFDKERTKRITKKGGISRLLHLKTGIKIDLWPLTQDSYDQVRFKRRVREKILERKTWLISPEDLIVTKLVWFKKSGIDKYFEDAKGICQIQKGRLDEEYLQKWAKKQKVGKLLEKLEK